MLKLTRKEDFMILNEPIIKVYELEYKEEILQDWQNAYLHTIGAFEYHVTEGYWMLLETENHYATIGYDGVNIYKKPYFFPEDKFEWWYNGDENYTDYVDTLLSGQRIHSVESGDGCQIISFDDFKLILYVYYENDNFDNFLKNFDAGVNIIAVGGHLTKKCECGGDAELLCDNHGDFAVRCSTCHRATYFDMILKNQIDEWNNNDTPCEIDTGNEILKQLLTDKKEIKYLSLSSRNGEFEMYNNNSYNCESIIMEFDDTRFLLSAERIFSNRFDFTGCEISGYNRAHWSKVIRPMNKITFLKEENHNDRKILQFKMDNLNLLIEATCRGLLVSFDKPQGIR